MTRLAPLGVYVHWPYCARICPYCDFNVFKHRGGEAPRALAAAIVADLKAQAELTGPRELVSVFFGGGTPSLMDPAWVAEVVAAARGLWPAEDPVEIALEANPTDAEAGRFAALAAAGVERLSLGVQSLHDDALAFLGRNHSAAEARKAMAVAARLFPRLSADLIYARPGQTPAAWTESLSIDHTEWRLDLGAFQQGLPGQLAVTAVGCGAGVTPPVTPPEDPAITQPFQECTWEIQGIMDVAPGLRLPPKVSSRLRIGFRELEGLLPAPPELEQSVAELGVGAVLLVSRCVLGGFDPDVLKVARVLGLPSIMLVFSWDNLSNKGLMHEIPDRVLVWNDTQRDEAITLHECPPERVVVTGAPRFDDFFAMESLIPRATLCDALGFDPERPILAYLCSSRFVAGEERQFVERWIAASFSACSDSPASPMRMEKYTLAWA